MSMSTTTTSDDPPPPPPASSSNEKQVEQVAETLKDVENAAEKLTREVTTVVTAIKKRAAETARNTRDHNEIVLQATIGVKDSVKMVEQASMEALLQISEMKTYFDDLMKFAKIAENVRRDLFYLEIEATHLRDKSVKRLRSAASAKSARAVRNNVDDVELQPVLKKVENAEK